MKPNRPNHGRLRLALAAFGVFSGALLCLPQTSQAQYTSTDVVASGDTWTNAHWYLNGTGTAMTPAAGNTYALVANGTAFGNSTANTRTRNPAYTGVQTFPGDSLTLGTNTELRMKNNGTILNFPGVGGNPGLILNGGVINVGDDGNFPITGIIEVEGQSYLCPGNNGGGGLSANARSADVQGVLTGSGTLVIFEASLQAPQKVSGKANTFTGPWVVRDGWLLGAGANSLGTNSITVDPKFVLAAPPFSSTAPVVDVGTNGNLPQLEVDYDLNSAGTLTLNNGGVFVLHQNCCFAAVTIGGTALAAGTHWYTNLIAQFPANFPANSYGTITVQPYGTPPTLPPATAPLVFTKAKWIDADLGGPAFAGSTATNADGSLTISGGGSDIWNNSSQFHYRYAWASGTNWDAIMQVESLVGPDQWSKVELLIDQADLNAGPAGDDSFLALMGTQPSSVIPPDGTAAGVNVDRNQYRTVRAGVSDEVTTGTTTPNYPNTWFRINRSGSVFTLYTSADGLTWTVSLAVDTSTKSLVGSDAGTTWGTPWPDVVCVGVAVTAHDDSWTDPNSGLPAGAVAVINNLEVTFPPATPPTLITASQQVQASLTNGLGAEATLYFVATNNAFPAPAAAGGPPLYQWYKNSSAIANATNTFYTWLLDSSDAGAKYSCQATLPAPYSNLKTNSANALIGLAPVIYYTNGLRMEFWTFAPADPAPTAGAAGAVDPRINIEQGNVGPATWESVRPNFDDPGGYGNYYASRVSGWFIPPATDSYVFFLAADDDTDLFLSTDASIANKVMIAQEAGWSSTDDWLDANGGNTTQVRSDEFADPVTGATPGASGFALKAGQPYFIEAVHYQGNGGDDLCVTYQTLSQVGSVNWPNVFSNGTPSLLYGTNANIMFATTPVTNLTWVTQPTNYTASLGFPGVFQAQAVSGSEFPVIYTWYMTNGQGTSVVGTTTSTTFDTADTVAANQGAGLYVVASTAEHELSLTSSVVTLNVAAPVLEYGWAHNEYWYTANPGVAAFYTADPVNTAINHLVTTYAVTPDNDIFEPRMEGESVSNEAGDNYTERCSALFYPPTTGTYDFWVNSDDDSALFVSTDSSPTNAVMVAQETQWSNPWQWQGDEGAATLNPMKSSQTWTGPDGTTPWASGIKLTAGQPYYVAIIHHEGTGGDNCEATFVTPSGSGIPGPADGAYSAMAGNRIASYVPRCFAMAFTQQPTNPTAPLAGIATFTAAAATDSKSAIGDENDPRNEWNNYVLYQWCVNGTPIAGANGSSYSFGPVTPLDASVQVTCLIRALGYVNSSLVDLWTTSTVATVTTTGGAVYEPGYVLHEYFTLDPPITTIADNGAGTPTWLMASPAFEVDTGDTEIADNFSDELVGYFIPPTNGNYVFFMNSDDNADLFLSTGDSAASKRMIAQELAWAPALDWGTSATAADSAQTRSDTFVDPATGLTLYSNGIPLIKGQKYFMQAVHEQGGGGTTTCVNEMSTGDPAYPTAPTSGSLSIMRGSLVGTYVPACSYVAFTEEPQNVTVDNYADATFAVVGDTDSTVPIGPEGDWRNSFNNFLLYQWYLNGTPVAGATTPALVLPEVLPTDGGDQIFCTIRALGYGDSSGNALWATSQVATLTIKTNAPQLVYAGVYTNSNYTNFFGGLASNYITLAFNGRMNAGLLSQMSTYQLGGGATLLGVLVNSNNYKSVALAFSGAAPTTVTVNSALSGAGGGLPVSNTSITVSTTELIDTDIGTPGTDPGVPGMMYVDGANAYTIACEGSDIWNNTDGFNFAYEKKTNDFDVVVRVLDEKHSSNWAKAGLMVRETLDPWSRDWNIINDPLASDGIMAPDNSGYGANTIECNARNTTVDPGGSASAAWTVYTNAVPPPYPNAWVRLTRTVTTTSTSTNDILQAYRSSDGYNWQQMGWDNTVLVGDMTPLPAVVYVGLCTTAHNNDALGASPLLYLNVADYADYGAPPLPAATLKVTRSGSNLILSWTPAGGTLQSSPALGAGANWQAVANPANPMTIPIGPASQYFRLQY